MWGNRLGWGISALIFIGYVALFGWMARALNVASAPTAFVRDPAHVAAIALPVAPVSAVPAMTQPTDAGPLYRRAIEHYLQNQEAYDAFLARSAARTRDGRPPLPPADVRGVDLLVEATACAQMHLFDQDPEQIVNYGPRPALDAVVSLGQVAIRLALLRQASGDSAAARRYAEAAMALGDKLFAERLCYAELMAGLRLMGDAAVVLARLHRAAGDEQRSDAIADFNVKRQEYFRSSIEPVARVVRSIEPRLIREHAGDIFFYARQAPERMWRVEAILSLGRMRFFVGESGRAGDQRAAERAVKRYQQDPDPVIRAAADAAGQLTLERYRTLW